MRFKKIWFFIFSLIIIWGCPSALLQAQETIQNDSIITVETAFDDLYSARLESLFSLKSFLVLSQNILDQEVDRLSTRLGINHPKVKRMKASIEHNQSIIHDLEVELEIAEIEIPEVPQGGVLVHGRVTSANGRGIPEMRVYGENENRKRVVEFGTSQKIWYIPLT